MPLGDAGAEDLKDSLGAVGAGGRVEPRALAERSENGKDSRWKELFRRTGQKTQGPDPGEITNASVAWGGGVRRGGITHPTRTLVIIGVLHGLQLAEHVAEKGVADAMASGEGGVRPTKTNTLPHPERSLLAHFQRRPVAAQAQVGMLLEEARAQVVHVRRDEVTVRSVRHEP